MLKKEKVRNYPELARFIRNFMENRELNVKQLAVHLYPITVGRIYDWVEGRRTMDGWEVSHFRKRTGELVPAHVLRGEDRFGRRKTNLNKQMSFENMNGAGRE